jgi:hypothetical protein
MNLTVSEARERIASAAGICSDDVRVISYLNRGVRRLLNKGKWAGTTIRYRVCVNSDCITWPRQIQTIEAVAVCDRPSKVRNEWFEFLEAGQGIMGTDSGNGLQLVDRGEACSFDDITAGSTIARIRVYSDVVEAASKYIILQGYDENGNWIRTQDGTTWIDGEKVTISTVPATPAVTTKKFSALVRVIKDVTNGMIRLYEYNGTSNVRALAFYEPDEKLPSYRRSFIPELADVNTSSTCESASVEVMAKLRFMEVSNENDFLLIGNVDALEEITRALVAYDQKQWPEAKAFEATALQLLQDELGAHTGDGAVLQMRVQMDNFGAGDVSNVCG